MRDIPAAINGVKIEFFSKVNRSVNESLITGLRRCIRPEIAKGFTLSKIFIYSANDQHEMPSRHSQAKAVDISRINGKRIGPHYASDRQLREIVNAIQTAFETFSGRRENFGPYLKFKHGKKWDIDKHKDHIHLSVD